MDSYQPPSLSDLHFSPLTEQALRADVHLGRKLAMIAKELHQLRLDSRHHQADLLPYYADKTAGYKAGTYTWMEGSKKALADDTTPAGILLVAARNVLGPGMAAWEPDTLRVELKNREEIKISDLNFNKLLSALTLLEVPAFYWEANVFSQTVMAFNHELPDPEILYEASAAQVCWAVYEAELILMEHQLHEPEFDYEPALYTAGVLHRAGFVLAPSLLLFAQSDLDDMNKGKAGLKLEEVRTAWAALDKKTLAAHTFPEDALNVHLAKLAACQVYVSEHADKYSAALRSLSDATS